MHCSAGRDRTGLITALLLANAGVAPRVIADDYAESVRVMADAPSNSPTRDRQAGWSPTTVASWLNQAGPIVADFSTHIDQHLTRIGLSRVARARLRALLLDSDVGEPPAAT